MQARLLISGVRSISFTNDYSASYHKYQTEWGVHQNVKKPNATLLIKFIYVVL